jgi:hypothetical protein
VVDRCPALEPTHEFKSKLAYVVQAAGGMAPGFRTPFCSDCSGAAARILEVFGKRMPPLTRRIAKAMGIV